MPVEISDEKSLLPFFQHLSEADKSWDDAPSKGNEEFYGVDVGVWGKGMLYVDGRMDLCKQYVLPLLIIPILPSSAFWVVSSDHTMCLGFSVLQTSPN